MRNIRISLPKKMATAIHIADAQVPFHDRRLWKLVLAFIKQYKPTYLINHGDFAECWHWSHYAKSPLEAPSYLTSWNADKEIEAVHEAWDELHKASPNSIFLYTLGNHEDRVARIKKDKLKDTIVKADNFIDLFQADKYWNEIVDYGYAIQLGHLFCTHGDTTTMYAAKKMLETWGRCVAFGHTHRHQFWCVNPKGDNIKAAWGLPCLCRLDPHYAVQPNWSWGIGYSKFLPSGNFNLQVLPITSAYNFVFGEKVWEG